MRELIRKILRETAESQNFQELCSSSEEASEMIKTFTLFRTSFCHKDSFNKYNEAERTKICGEPSEVFIRGNEACSSSIIKNQYENPQLRENFNKYANLPTGCNVSDIRTCREKVDLTPIKSKDAPKAIEGPKTEPKLMKQTSVPLPQVDTKLLQKIKKAFVNLTNNINYTTYKIKQKI